MGWWKHAKAGDKVVCVEGPSPETGVGYLVKGFVFPEIGKIYTIKEIWVSGHYTHVTVSEIDNLAASKKLYGLGAKECGLPPRGFKPVQTKSTDKSMEALRSHLTGKTLEVAQ